MRLVGETAGGSRASRVTNEQTTTQRAITYARMYSYPTGHGELLGPSNPLEEICWRVLRHMYVRTCIYPNDHTVHTHSFSSQGLYLFVLYDCLMFFWANLQSMRIHRILWHSKAFFTHPFDKTNSLVGNAPGCISCA